MRLLAQIRIPHEKFNALTRDGSVGKKIGRIVEATKPESIYFTNQSGCRGAVAIYDCPSDSDIPALAEPWFLTFNADVQFQIAMTPDDLGRAGLDKLGKDWR